MELIKIYELIESSTIGGRKKFMEALAFAKKQKETIAVVTDKVDRLQRSYKETPMLDSLVEKEKIELYFYTENCIIQKYSTSQERMTLNMFVMMAQSYVDSLRDNVNRSIVQEIEKYNKADDKFSERLIDMVELASGAARTFKGSTIEGKRKLIKLVFANLKLKGQKLEYSLRPPFDAFVKTEEIEEWRTQEDSNPRPTD